MNAVTSAAKIMEAVTLRRVARIAVAPLRQGEGADGFG